MQVVILCDQEMGVLRIKRFYYFLISLLKTYLTWLKPSYFISIEMFNPATQVLTTNKKKQLSLNLTYPAFTQLLILSFFYVPSLPRIYLAIKRNIIL